MRHTQELSAPPFFSSSCILFGESGVREGAEEMERRRGEGEIERCRKSLRFAKLQLFSGTKSDDVRGGAVGEGAKVSCSLCCCSSLNRRNRRRRRTIKNNVCAWAAKARACARASGLRRLKEVSCYRCHSNNTRNSKGGVLFNCF